MPVSADQPGSISDSGRLSGWKQIATYLQKSERTVYRWERLGLPVHRVKIDSGESVYAYRAEIDGWLAGRETEATATPRAGVEPGATPTKGRGRRLLLGVAAVGTMSGAWLLHSALPAAPPQATLGSPAKWQVTGDRLRVFDQQGERLWERSFGFPLRTGDYAPTNAHAAGTVAIEDLDGDGSLEVLFVTMGDISADCRLFCFESDGALRFEHSVDHAVSFGGRQHSGFSVQRFLVTTDASGAKSIWVISQHNLWFPSTVQRLSSEGRLVAEFWHDGHIPSVPWHFVVGGRRVILIGATNNEFGGAGLAVLDYESPGGSTPAENTDYRCTDCSHGQPLAYLVFPSSDVARFWNARPYVSEMRLEGGSRLVVSVTQTDASPKDPALHTARIYYTLDDTFRVIEAESGDNFPAAHSRLELLGRLDHAFGAGDIADLSRVRAWNGRSFMSTVVPKRSIASR